MERFIIPAVASLLATAAHAQSADTIVVTATRTPEPISRVGQSISLLTATDIDLRQRVEVVELLHDLPGVAVARNGGPGGVATLRIRGAESDQTLVLVDGVRLNDPAAVGGGFDFSNLLTGNIRRIELLRGPASVLWGSQAIGGVVAVETQAPTPDPTLNGRAEIGSRDTYTLTGNASGTAGPFGLSVGGGRFVSDGISAFSEARSGRERDGFNQTAANAKLTVALGQDASIDLRGYWARGTVDLDGFAPPTFSFGDTTGRQRTEQKLGYAGLNLALFEGRLKNRLAVAASGTNRTNFNEANDPVVNFASRGTATRFEYQGVLALGSGASATFGAETERSRYRTQSFGPFGGPAAVASTRIDSVYGQLVADIVPGVTLTGGMRHDDHDRFGGATTLAAAVAASPNGGETLFRASFAQGFKVPTLFQLLSEYGNQALRPERSEGFDASVRQRLGPVELSAAAYTRTTRNLIDFVSCFGVASPICIDRPFGTYDNVLRARSRGVELSARAELGDLTLQGQYSFTDARNRTQESVNFDRLLPRRPRNIASLRADWRATDRLRLGASLFHSGATFDDAANRGRLARYTLVGVTAGYDVTNSVELYGRVENLTDEVYETARLYGAPPRWVTVGVRATW